MALSSCGGSGGGSNGTDGGGNITPSSLNTITQFSINKVSTISGIMYWSMNRDYCCQQRDGSPPISDTCIKGKFTNTISPLLMEAATLQQPNNTDKIHHKNIKLLHNHQYRS